VFSRQFISIDFRRVIEQIFLVSNSNFTADQQWEALSAFIEGDSYLRGRKGNYVERNADRLKWSHVVDLKLA
jgi:hypothetical protein